MSTGLVFDIDGTVLPHTPFSPFGDLVDVGHEPGPSAAVPQNSWTTTTPGSLSAWMTFCSSPRRRTTA